MKLARRLRNALPISRRRYYEVCEEADTAWVREAEATRRSRKLERAVIAGVDNHRCELSWAQQLFGGPFPFAMLREIYGLEDDIARDIERQVWGSTSLDANIGTGNVNPADGTVTWEIHHDRTAKTGLAGIVEGPGLLTAPGYQLTDEEAAEVVAASDTENEERGDHPCTHCGDPSCSYDEDC